MRAKCEQMRAAGLIRSKTEHGRDYIFDTVDIFHGNTWTWTTARLSAARVFLAATSVESQGLAIFAGGVNGVLQLPGNFSFRRLSCTGEHGNMHVVDIFDAKTKAWSTARLSSSRAALAATSLPLQGVAIFAGGFNGKSLLLRTLAIVCADHSMQLKF
jgi:hypothetical protein